MTRNLKKRLTIIMTVALLNIALLCIALYQLHTLDKKQQDIATVAPTPTPAVSASSVSPVMTATPAPSEPPEIVKIDTSSDNSLQRIVNSSAPLNKEYIPENLVQFENTEEFIRADAVTPLQQLFQAAAQNGYSLYLVSGYRSYDEQVYLYNVYSQRYGTDYADSIDDKPGQSEHQLGLMVDIGLSDGTCLLQDCFNNLPVAEWLRNNAYLYGFIERYPEGKQSITGIQPSAWNYRYVGVEEAKKIHESNLTMEEYYLG